MVRVAAEKKPLEDRLSLENSALAECSEQSSSVDGTDDEIGPTLFEANAESISTTPPSPVHVQTQALEAAFGGAERSSKADELEPCGDDWSSPEHSIPYALAALSEPYLEDQDNGIDDEPADANVALQDAYGMVDENRVCEELGASLIANVDDAVEEDFIATFESSEVEVTTETVVIEKTSELEPLPQMIQEEGFLNRTLKRFSPSKIAVDAAAEIGLTAKGPDGKSAAHTEPVREEISMFAGPNGHSYADAWYALRTSEADERPGWSMPAFTFSIAWFAYRKLYRAAMLALITLSATMVYQPVLGVVMLAAIMICAGMYGKSLYVSHADATIRSKMSAAKDADAYLEAIKRSGGVSWVMGAVSALCVFGLAMLGGLSLSV